jgi:uncharacterized protein (TIGR02284 family)
MAVSREEIIVCINDLIETCRNGEKGFLTASEHITDNNLKAYFLRCSYQRAQFAAELQGEVRQLGGDPTSIGSVSGAFHRGWMNIRSAIAEGDESILSECEWGEDSGLRNYERVLKQNLPHHVLPVVKHQYVQIKETHNQIRSLEKRAA